YLARLQNIAGDRPLIMSELGLDSWRNGEGGQMRSLDWQVRTAFAAGCAGVFVFSWTDEWYRHGHDVGDWAFGLTRTDRSLKPALDSVREAFAEVPYSAGVSWPRISVVVCTYNGGRTSRDCLEGLCCLAYPDYEVILVDDGSTDDASAVAREFDVRLIRTANRGLATARNTGLKAATGEIVAYIDDDAHPDPHWLTYLAATFLSTSHADVAGEVQRAGPRALGGAHVRRRADPHARVAAPAGLSRRLGRRAVSVALPTCLQSVGLPPPDAGMASHDGEPRRDRRAERRMETIQAGPAAAGGRHGAPGRASLGERGPR